MDNRWLVRDILTRIDADQQPVGLYLQWCEYYAMVTCDEAKRVLGRMPPTTLLKVNVSGGTLFVGWEV